jgi:hypothetical protein
LDGVRPRRKPNVRQRVYVARDEQLETANDEDEDEDLPLVIPGGEVLYRET